MLNAVIIRYAAANELRKCEEVLEEMANQAIWSPVTYCLAKRLHLSIRGRPAYPGLRLLDTEAEDDN